MDHHDEWAHWPGDDDPFAGGADDPGHPDDPGGNDGVDQVARAGQYDDGQYDDTPPAHDPFDVHGPLDPAAPDLLHDFVSASGPWSPDAGFHDGGFHDAGFADVGDGHGIGADPGAAHDDTGYGPGHAGPGPDEVHGDAGVAHLVGTEPDRPGAHDGRDDGHPWAESFPPALDLPQRPTPVDGYPWSDPELLGGPADGAGSTAGSTAGSGVDLVAGVGGAPPADDLPVDDLLSYAGLAAPGDGADPWALLRAGDDPAASALARWWGPDR